MLDVEDVAGVSLCIIEVNELRCFRCLKFASSLGLLLLEKRAGERERRSTPNQFHDFPNH